MRRPVAITLALTCLSLVVEGSLRPYSYGLGIATALFAAGWAAWIFHLPIRIEQFIGRWLPMPGHQRCRLGEAQGSALGQTALVGEQVWDCAQTIRIVCGPLSLERYERMLPGGDSWLRWTNLYVHDTLLRALGTAHPPNPPADEDRVGSAKT